MVGSADRAGTRGYSSGVTCSPSLSLAVCGQPRGHDVSDSAGHPRPVRSPLPADGEEARLQGKAEWKRVRGGGKLARKRSRCAVEPLVKDTPEMRTPLK